ncbi:hypothetical protein, partial [Erythrobacter sp.]|uniref:hypothetical protein n=1 Tax=Erythrobacter sp. TaxID=1042 RepID=UPI003C74F04A
AVVSRDFVGRPTAGYWRTPDMGRPALNPSFGAVIVAQGIERALSLAASNGLSTLAVQDICFANHLTFPQNVYEICIDALGLEPEAFERIASALQARAFMVERLADRASQENCAVARLR